MSLIGYVACISILKSWHKHMGQVQAKSACFQLGNLSILNIYISLILKFIWQMHKLPQILTKQILNFNPISTITPNPTQKPNCNPHSISMIK